MNLVYAWTTKRRFWQDTSRRVRPVFLNLDHFQWFEIIYAGRDPEWNLIHGTIGNKHFEFKVSHDEVKKAERYIEEHRAPKETVK